ncbi:uncharacterized protein [Littorina saxatilis]|uniref:uncharacterized protein isoform X3 n=1 Tax=Littorina saxatilis TaxID=31220 RepID=UPI0038B68251
MKMDRLELCVEGAEPRTFGEWTADFVDTYYPDVDQRCYRVPALHFNQQTWAKGDRTEISRMTLVKPAESDAIGTEAHTFMLNAVQDLGQLMQQRHQSPFFIIDSLDFDSYLAKARPAEPGGPLPATPGQRGEVDVVVLSQQWGVTLMEVKATGHSKWRHADQEIRESVQKAVKQVQNARNIIRRIMPDLFSRESCVAMVVALPYLTSQKLQQALIDHKHEGIVFLCKDDLHEPKSQVTAENNTEATATSSETAQQQRPSPLYRWWMDNFNGGDDHCDRPPAMPLQDIKTIVGRVLGLLSVVAISTKTRPRVEVRTRAQAISQVADCFSRIVLTPAQAAILASKRHTHVCLAGCVGSGKTLLLQLKGRQWLREGRRVVILNIRTTARGRAAGHVLEDAIANDVAAARRGSVLRYNTTVAELDIAKLKAELRDDRESTEDVCFLLDELSPRHTAGIIPKLRHTFLHNPIWFVSLAVARVPAGFHLYRLTQCLRCPPSIQLLLKELDLNPFHKNAYSTRSVAQGLPCDGPPVFFIYHKDHKNDVRPDNCVKCAEELVEFMKAELRLVIHARSSAEEPEEQAFSTATAKKRCSTVCSQSTDKSKSKYVEAKPLSFRDILILMSLPNAYFKHVGGGHWETKIEDVLEFIISAGLSLFLFSLSEQGVPCSPVIDSTSAEIARPVEDKVIITDVLAVPSLERKVVIFLPGGEVPIDSQVDSCKLRKLLDACQESDPSDKGFISKTVSPQSCQQSSKPPSSKSEGHQNQTQQSLEALVAFFKPSCNSKEPPSPDEVKLHILRIFGNTLVRYMESISKGLNPSESDVHAKDKTPLASGGKEEVKGKKLRMGMDLRGDSPSLQAAFYQFAKPQRRNTKNPVSSHTAQSHHKDSDRSLFLVPDRKTLIAAEPEDDVRDAERERESKENNQEGVRKKEGLTKGGESMNDNKVGSGEKIEAKQDGQGEVGTGAENKEENERKGGIEEGVKNANDYAEGGDMTKDNKEKSEIPGDSSGEESKEIGAGDDENKCGDQKEDERKEGVPGKCDTAEAGAEMGRSMKEKGHRTAASSEQTEDDLRQSELRRIRQAVSSLSMDDQDSLFMAASRCLSQLVVIIP